MNGRPEHIPNHWGSATVEELTDFVTSGSRGWAKHYADDGPLFLRVGNLDHDTVGIDLSDIAHVRPPEGAEGERTRVQPGDILLSITAEVGMVGLAPKGLSEAYVNQHIALVRPRSTVWAQGLAYAFLDPQGLQALAKRTQYGATKPGLSLIQVRSFQVGVPPLPEQHRIVEAIESYFTRLDDAVATLERVQRNLKRYRASVLKAAVEGRLVPTEAELARAEGRDYEPASVLLERILAERRRHWHAAGGRGEYREPVEPDTAKLPELPEGWCWATVDGLLREPLRNGHSARKAVDGDVRTLTLSAVTERSFSETNTKLTAADRRQVRDLWLEPGDIFVERSNTPELVGTSALYRGPRGFAIFPDLLIRVRPAQEAVPSYMEAVFRSPRARVFFRRAAQGIAGSMPKIGQETVAALAVPLPPLPEQHRIFAELDRQLSLADEAESSVALSKTRCTRLRQAILKWAFAGKLADQELRDEPAAALLERIRSETLPSRASARHTANTRPQRSGRRTPRLRRATHMKAADGKAR